MSTCKHKWEKEPFAGSLKCAKCDYVEFDVAGECLSLQEHAEAAEARVKELEGEKHDIEMTWTPEQFESTLGKLTALFMKSKEVGASEFFLKSSSDNIEAEWGFKSK